MYNFLPAQFSRREFLAAHDFFMYSKESFLNAPIDTETKQMQAFVNSIEPTERKSINISTALHKLL